MFTSFTSKSFTLTFLILLFTSSLWCRQSLGQEKITRKAVVIDGIETKTKIIEHQDGSKTIKIKEKALKGNYQAETLQKVAANGEVLSEQFQSSGEHPHHQHHPPQQNQTFVQTSPCQNRQPAGLKLEMGNMRMEMGGEMRMGDMVMAPMKPMMPMKPMTPMPPMKPLNQNP